MKNMRLAQLALILSLALVWHSGPAQNGPSSTRPTPAIPGPLATNIQITLEAWNAFRAGDNATTVAKADSCIRQFQHQANRIQAALDAEKAHLPKGKASPSDKSQVDRYQVLHDVARCYLLKGLAEERLNHREAARAAYAQAQKYTQARIHDPATDTFWSPAEKAAERLANL